MRARARARTHTHTHTHTHTRTQIITHIIIAPSPSFGVCILSVLTSSLGYHNGNSPKQTGLWILPKTGYKSWALLNGGPHWPHSSIRFQWPWSHFKVKVESNSCENSKLHLSVNLQRSRSNGNIHIYHRQFHMLKRYTGTGIIQTELIWNSLVMFIQFSFELHSVCMR